MTVTHAKWINAISWKFSISCDYDELILSTSASTTIFTLFTSSISIILQEFSWIAGNFKISLPLFPSLGENCHLLQDFSIKFTSIFFAQQQASIISPIMLEHSLIMWDIVRDFTCFNVHCSARKTRDWMLENLLKILQIGNICYCIHTP